MTVGMHGRPTAAELVGAVAGFLDSDVRQATQGQVNFHARVATNVLRIVERELSQDGEPADELAQLGFADEAQLAAAIRDGELDDRPADVTAFLRTLVHHRLAVANPGYATNAIADRLFSAIEAGDVDAVAGLFSDDISAWQTADRRTRNKARALKVIDWFVSVSADRHYDVLSRVPFDRGFVQQHVLHGAANDGTPYSIRVAIIVGIGAGGLITSVDEYFDPATLEPLNKQAIPSSRR